MELPHKRARFDQQINADAAVLMQNYEDQPAIIDSLTSIAGQGHLHSSQRRVIAPSANITSVPTTMTTLQQNEALRKETRRGTTTAMAGRGWNFVEHFPDDLWNFDFDLNFITAWAFNQELHIKLPMRPLFQCLDLLQEYHASQTQSPFPKHIQSSDAGSQVRPAPACRHLRGLWTYQRS